MKIEINQVATIKNGEITLFREMSNILSRHYSTTFIQETHQHYVRFNSPTIGCTAKREIADLWIIAFSPSSMKIRMTFLQAKFHRGILDQHNTEFRGDYFQYELLATRAAITNAGSRVNLPTNILSAQCLPSVGSYGVFFIDHGNQIDLAYCSAKYLTASTQPTHYAGFQTKLNIPFYNSQTFGDCDCPGWEELISCFNIDDFTKRLFKFLFIEKRDWCKL